MKKAILIAGMVLAASLCVAGEWWGETTEATGDWDERRYSDDNYSAEFSEYFLPYDSSLQWGNLTDGRGTHGTTFGIELFRAAEVLHYVFVEDVWVERPFYEEYGLPIALVAAEGADLQTLMENVAALQEAEKRQRDALEQQMIIRREELAELEKLTIGEKAKEQAQAHVEDGGGGRAAYALAGLGGGYIASEELNNDEDKSSKDSKGVTIDGSNNDVVVGSDGSTQSNDGNNDRADGTSNQDVDNK